MQINIEKIWERLNRQMRTQSTQFLSMNRLPKQSLLVYSKNAGEGYKQAGMDSFNDITISRPEYDQEYKCKRRT